MFLSQRYLCSVMLIILYIVYRVLSLSVNPMLRTYINLSKQHRLCLRRKLPKDMYVGLTSTICRNLEFYQNDTKIRRKLAYEMYSCVQLLGASPPPDPDQGLCPWTPLGAQPPDPIISSRYRARHSLPNANAKTKLRHNTPIQDCQYSKHKYQYQYCM